VLNICRRNFGWLALALFLAWSFGPSAQAQTAQASKKTLTLDEAVDFALKHYPAVRASLERSTGGPSRRGIGADDVSPRADTVWHGWMSLLV
jgi:hypothetical protein